MVNLFATRNRKHWVAHLGLRPAAIGTELADLGQKALIIRTRLQSYGLKNLAV